MSDDENSKSTMEVKEITIPPPNPENNPPPKSGNGSKGKKRFPFYMFCLFLLVVFGILFWYISKTTPHQGIIVSNDETSPLISNVPPNETIDLYYIDVGQGDATLIKQGDNIMLIDSGPSSNSDALLSFLNNMGITKIDILIGTHGHEDHIGNLSKVIENYEIGTFYMPKSLSTTKSYENLLNTVSSTGLKINYPKVNSNFNFGYANCTILAPYSMTNENGNDDSMVLRITFKNNAFLIMGDAEIKTEKQILKSGEDIKVDVLKIAHHGSEDSTSREFIEKTNPKYAVLSCSAKNSYHFPSGKVMKLLEEKNIILYRTDESSTIGVHSDGDKIIIDGKIGSYNKGE